jgi:hypothetical protein
MLWCAQRQTGVSKLHTHLLGCSPKQHFAGCVRGGVVAGCLLCRCLLRGCGAAGDHTCASALCRASASLCMPLQAPVWDGGTAWTSAADEQLPLCW